MSTKSRTCRTISFQSSRCALSAWNYQDSLPSSSLFALGESRDARPGFLVIDRQNSIPSPNEIGLFAPHHTASLYAFISIRCCLFVYTLRFVWPWFHPWVILGPNACLATTGGELSVRRCGPSPNARDWGITDDIRVCGRNVYFSSVSGELLIIVVYDLFIQNIDKECKFVLVVFGSFLTRWHFDFVNRHSRTHLVVGTLLIWLFRLRDLDFTATPLSTRTNDQDLFDPFDIAIAKLQNSKENWSKLSYLQQYKDQNC